MHLHAISLPLPKCTRTPGTHVGKCTCGSFKERSDKRYIYPRIQSISVCDIPEAYEAKPGKLERYHIYVTAAGES